MSTMPLPIFMTLAKPCLVVGGGAVALRKAGWLLEHGATVAAVARGFVDGFSAFDAMAREKLTLRREEYAGGELSTFALVFAATDDAEVNRRVAADAKAAGVPVNVADAPELCDFFVPGSVQRRRFQVAATTGGDSPALAARVREEIEERYPVWYGDYSEALGHVRKRLMVQCPETETRRELMRRLSSRKEAEAVKKLPLHEMTEALFARAEELRREAGGDA